MLVQQPLVDCVFPVRSLRQPHSNQLREVAYLRRQVTSAAAGSGGFERPENLPMGWFSARSGPEGPGGPSHPGRVFKGQRPLTFPPRQISVFRRIPFIRVRMIKTGKGGVKSRAQGWEDARSPYRITKPYTSLTPSAARRVSTPFSHVKGQASA